MPIETIVKYASNSDGDIFEVTEAWEQVGDHKEITFQTFPPEGYSVDESLTVVDFYAATEAKESAKAELLAERSSAAQLLVSARDEKKEALKVKLGLTDEEIDLLVHGGLQ